VISVLPRLASSRRTLRFRLGRWVSNPHDPAPASVIGLGARVRLLDRAGGRVLPTPRRARCRLFDLARAALPLRRSSCGSVAARSCWSSTQAGAGGAALAATGVGASEALHVAISIGVLGVLTGTAVLVAAIVWRSGTLLLPRTSG
jgi:hypothetical protein